MTNRDDVILLSYAMNLKYPEKEEQRDEAALKHTLNDAVYKVATVEKGAKGIIEEHEAD